MAKTNALTALAVRNAKNNSRIADGGGLYLSTTNGGKRWTFIYRWDGKRREMGLGSAATVKLADARILASAARDHLAAGVDPVAGREAARTSAAIPKSATFASYAEDYISSVEHGWRNEKHRQQWRSSLKTHAASLSVLDLDAITTDHVLAVLRPIWSDKPETAGRVRGRIEKILNAAKARGLRSRDAANPAQWRGHLDILLPLRSKLSRGHHRALPYSEMPSFMQLLAGRPAMAAKALTFLIHCASRSGEVLGARWGEIEGSLWTVPADRMKGGRPHTVPLSNAAQHLISEMERGRPTDFVFHGGEPDRPMSNMAMAMLLRRMKMDVTVHGFRSTFKDWSANETSYPDELSEESLAHVIGSAVRRAYRRGEAIERRRKLMDEWSGYILQFNSKLK
jgi:integrase